MTNSYSPHSDTAVTITIYILCKPITRTDQETLQRGLLNGRAGSLNNSAAGMHLHAKGRGVL